MEQNLKNKTLKLRELFEAYRRPCIAFSGGVDSALLVKIASEVNTRAIAVTADGAMLPRSELDAARAFVKHYRLEHRIIPIDLFSQEAIAENGARRCYFCKKYIFEKLIAEAKTRGCDAVFDGTNMDDFNDYRPGLRALEELKVISPFVQAEMTKEDIRALSRLYGLETADKPAMACLATRLPMGERITRAKLSSIEAGEEILKQAGLKQYRLRMLDSRSGKIECLQSDFETVIRKSQTLTAALEAAGFENILLDLKGYRQGSMNEVKK